MEGSPRAALRRCHRTLSADLSTLVIDVGSSSVRATVVGADGAFSGSASRSTPPVRASSGTVEIDADDLFDAVLDVAARVVETTGHSPTVCALATQRASTVLFDRTSGRPVAPALSWQDIRTTGQCLALRAEGLRLQPSQSATKLAWLYHQVDPAERATLGFGTLETYLAFRLSGGAAHVTDATNAAVTGLLRADASGWDPEILRVLRIPDELLPTIVPSTATVGPAVALPGAPELCGLVGDQQASLIGQGCVTKGRAKLTCGTGAMLDLCCGVGAPVPTRGDAGTFPIVAWRDSATTVFGIEAIMLSAGSAIRWLVDGLGILADPGASDALAGSVRDAGGVTFVPAFGGVGTPIWDYGARGAFFGISSGTTRAEMVRAVLEGVAHRSRDLLDAVEQDSGTSIDAVALDGGMSANTTFVALVASALGRPVDRSAVTEATTLGAAMLAGVATGRWEDLGAACTIVPLPERVEPAGTLDRDHWIEMRTRALRTVPALSMLSF